MSDQPSPPLTEARVSELVRVELERSRETRPSLTNEARLEPAKASETTLAVSLSLSLLGGQLVEEVMKSRPMQWAFIATMLIGSLIVARRRAAK